jgi:hypothetical protein
LTAGKKLIQPLYDRKECFLKDNFVKIVETCDVLAGGEGPLDALQWVVVPHGAEAEVAGSCTG